MIKDDPYDDPKFREQLQRVMELLRTGPHPSRPPTDEMLIRGMTSVGVQVTPEEAQQEQDSMTAEHYDDWVLQCVHELDNGRILAGVDGRTVEHPVDRLHRIGEESIREGKPSELYLYLKKQLEDGAVLQVLTHPNKAMKTAQLYLVIANEYKEFLRKHLKSPTWKTAKGGKLTQVVSLRETKANFKKSRPESTDTIDNALKAHNLDSSAYSVESPRKEKRRKPLKKG